VYIHTYRGADKSLARHTARCILFDGENISFDVSLVSYIYSTGVLISSKPDQEGNKLQRQKVLMLIDPIYCHNWGNISTIYVYNKTSIKRNILIIQQNTPGSRSG